MFLFFIFANAKTHDFEIAPNVTVPCDVDMQFQRVYISSPPKIIKVDQIEYQSRNISGCLNISGTVSSRKKKFSVSKINDYAFFNTSITEVILPSTVFSVGISAFANCEKLVRADFSRAVLYKIPNGLFNNSYSLREFIICPTIVTIGEFAYAHTQITNITIGKLLKHFSPSALCNCTKLSNIDIDIKNNLCTMKNGCLYSKNMNTLIHQDSWLKNNTIARDTSIIGEFAYAFSRVRYVLIPYHITTIGADAFRGCQFLKKVDFDRGCLTKICERAFFGSMLQVLVLPPTVSEVGTMAFGMPGLTDIDLVSTNLTSIPAKLFAGARNVYEIGLPDVLGDIDPYAFVDCNVNRILYCGEFSFKQYDLGVNSRVICDKKRVVEINMDDPEEEKTKNDEDDDLSFLLSAIEMFNLDINVDDL